MAGQTPTIVAKFARENKSTASIGQDRNCLHGIRFRFCHHHSAVRGHADDEVRRAIWYDLVTFGHATRDLDSSSPCRVRKCPDVSAPLKIRSFARWTLRLGVFARDRPSATIGRVWPDLAGSGEGVSGNVQFCPALQKLTPPVNLAVTGFDRTWPDSDGRPSAIFFGFAHVVALPLGIFFSAEPVPWSALSPKIFFLVRAVSVMPGLRGLRQPLEVAASKKFRINFRKSHLLRSHVSPPE
jgi:hypothetical protein